MWAHERDRDFEYELESLLKTLRGLEKPSEDVTQTSKSHIEIPVYHQEDVKIWQSELESMTGGHMVDILLRMLKRQEYHFLAAAKAALVDVANNYMDERLVCEYVIAQSGGSLAPQKLYYVGIDVRAMLESYKQKECDYNPIIRSRHNMMMQVMVYHYPWTYFLDTIPMSYRLQSAMCVQTKDNAILQIKERCKIISDTKTIALLSCYAQLRRLSYACLYMYTLLVGCVRSLKAKKVSLKQISEYLCDNAKYFLQFANFKHRDLQSNFNRMCGQIIERTFAAKERRVQGDICQLSGYMLKICQFYFRKMDYVPHGLLTRQLQKRVLVATDSGSQKRVHS